MLKRNITEQAKYMDTIIINIITWVLVIASWFILNMLANCREKRKELYSLIKDIRQQIDITTDLAEKYHTAEAHSPELSEKIKFMIQEINNWNEILESCKLKIDLMNHVKFRQAVTGKNFDSNTFATQPHNGKLLYRIQKSSLELKNGIIKAFSKKYH